jgi:hypothetical protein
MITTYSILHCMNWALESRSQVQGVHFWLSSILHCMNLYELSPGIQVSSSIQGVHFWLSSILHCMNLYELSPGIQVSSSRCTFLVKFYITLYEPVWTEPWNPGLKFVKIQSKSVHGVCSLHLHVKTNILMIENMLTTCIVTQSPSKRSQQCPTTHVQLTFWQTGHTRG